MPTTLLDTLEAKAARGDKYDAEIKRHNTTLSILDDCEKRAVASETLRDEYKAERDAARAELRGRLPTWAKVTAVVVIALASAGTGAYIGVKLSD